MVHDQNLVRTLYKKLLSLYPRGFRVQLGESMAQSFHDLYIEQKQRANRGLFSFTLWMFIETTIGIFREHLLLIMEGNAMKNIFANPSSAAITSLILAMPLGLTYVALMFNIEPLARVLNNLFTIEGQQGEINMLGRIVIFGGLLLLPVALALNLRPLLRKEGAEGKRRLYAINIIVGVIIVLLIAVTWGGLIVEEIYCLMGIRCD